MADKVKLAKLLRALAQIVDSASEEELEALQRSKISDLITADRHSKKARRSTLSSGNPSDSVDISGILDSMRYLSSRAAGVAFLERHELNKRYLEQIARRLDLPVLREDNTERLIQKIVEATIGPRLNSEAIRGEAGNR
jgi:hypothetical protein